MAGSEKAGRDLGPAGMGDLLEACHQIVEDVVRTAGGLVGGWQGDGAVAFFATTGIESELIRRGEAAARKTLNQLAVNLPGRCFRIGAATGRGRFRLALGQISEPCVVLAARLESEAKDRAEGSALLIPADVHSTLDDAARRLYHDAGKRDGQQLFVYCTNGSPSLRPAKESQETQATACGGELGFEMIDPAWPWAGKNDLYYAFAAIPADKITYDKSKHSGWIESNYLTLPMGGQIYRKESLRDGWLLYYVAEQEDGLILQALRFMSQGAIIFGDGGLTRMGRQWKNGFFPQAMLKPLNQFLKFTQGYYAQAHGYSGQIFIRIGVINVAGRDRLLGEHVFGVMPWKFDRDLLTSGNFLVEELTAPTTIKTLYDELMLQSELDPAKFGLPAL